MWVSCREHRGADRQFREHEHVGHAVAEAGVIFRACQEYPGGAGDGCSPRGGEDCQEVGKSCYITKHMAH